MVNRASCNGRGYAIFLSCLLATVIGWTAGLPGIPAMAQTAPVREKKMPNRHTRTENTKVVTITNSGSTNVAGYTVRVKRNGDAYYTVKWKERSGKVHPSGEQTGKVSAELAEQLFHHVEDAMPLTQYPREHCMKSASFGYTLQLDYDGQESPDLSCGSKDPKLRALQDDVQAVVAALNIKPSPGE